MTSDTRFQVKNKQGIHAIEPSDKRIAGRAGLALFAQYLIHAEPRTKVWFEAKK